MSVLHACVKMYHMSAWCIWRPEQCIRSHITRVTDHHELPCGYWAVNPGPQKEQPVLSQHPQTILLTHSYTILILTFLNTFQIPQ